MEFTKAPTDGFALVAEIALELFGTDHRSARRRVVRLCDQGELAHVRLGPRGDRWILRSEIDRFKAAADENRGACT